ncbi:MAG: 1-acyl-sn-glycerol-3-phosphate acyltransferase [Deltaproteobacteria bacterium]|nr:1-acyl-sn-glycerol-3-phosphate acyltransferase [Deltaproteobacteria bacterium]MBN2846611.1 1-acyl-sn-glycerol-3-phosphate acyltransferase [Deltaproteobacteria bacterium]
MNALLRGAKIVWVCFWMSFASILLFLPITISAFLSSTGNLPFTISKAWAWIMLKVTWVHPEIKGKEYIRKNQSYIIISNHQSHFDILALVTKLGMQFRWIIKKELRKIPLFGYALYKSRNIYIDRSNREKAVESIHNGVSRLPEGASIMFFAEGTRSPDGKIHPFKKGGFMTALETGFPILPVTVNGSRKILPKKSVEFHPGPIEVIVNKPINTNGYTPEKIDELIDRTRSVITSHFNPDYPERGGNAR